jgi:hypothetical protein
LRLLASTVVVALVAACGPIQESRTMFTADDFAHLRFLEGRWEGLGPDGKTFFEEYVFTGEAKMQSNRYADDAFATIQDSSVVALDGDRVTSTWGEFTWEASDLSPGKACFTPVDAPSAFCWEMTSDTTVSVTQRWTDEHGEAQQYVVPLQRL